MGASEQCCCKLAFSVRGGGGGGGGRVPLSFALSSSLDIHTVRVDRHHHRTAVEKREKEP